MKCIVKFFFIIGVFLTPLQLCLGQAEKELSELEITVLSSTSEIIKLYKEESTSIWPGFDLSIQPFIVYIPGEWTLLVNYDKQIDGFTKYPDGWPELNTNAIIHYGNYEGLIGQLEFNFVLDSLTTIAIGFPQGFFNFEDDEDRLMIFAFIIHESFHQYQRQSFGEIPWAREEKYPILDIHNTSLAFLEIRILSDALHAMDSNMPAKCQNLYNDFQTVRDERWNEKSGFIAKYEQGQEINEGTAKYVEVKSVFKMIERANCPDIDMRDDYKKLFQSESIKDYLMDDMESRMINNTIAPEDVTRNRIYPVGAAQGILHDYLSVKWKKRAEEAGENFLLYDPEYNKVTDSIRFVSNINRIKRRYNYNNVIESTRLSINKFMENYQLAKGQFDNQKGNRIEVNFNYKSLSRSRSSRSKKWVVDNGEWTLCLDYRIFKLKSGNCSISLENMGILQFNDWDNKYSKVIFYSKEISSIFLDTIEYNLSDISSSRFSRLRLMGEGIDIEIKSKGTIMISGIQIIIEIGSIQF